MDALQPNDTNSFANDPIFAEEQAHLDRTYTTLTRLKTALTEKIARENAQAAEDKSKMAEELSFNFATDDDAMETYADFAAINRIIQGYNIAHDSDMRKLADVELLLKQPYFAKIQLQFKPGEAPKELYLGNAGVSDENYKRLIVDWRSPVAEVYYSQDEGETSYQANGRTIRVNLQLRRQFDIEGNVLHAYFDTPIAIQDSLLLASLSRKRSAQMQAITATIQKEQNTVIRHEDVPVLLVSGIAGSGKTSVLLQRVAYLFYRNRETLNPRDVYILSPNAVFGHYIDAVLPDMGEQNPQILTWDNLTAHLLPPGRSKSAEQVDLSVFQRIDAALEGFAFDARDFRDISLDGKVIVPAAHIAHLAAKFPSVPAGPHLITLMREELLDRLESRMRGQSKRESAQDELAALSQEEQLEIFHETIAPQSEEDTQKLTLRYLRHRYAGVLASIKRDEWVRIDRIGMRLLGSEDLPPLTWLYLKMALTGLSNPEARYVMVDEVQDYSPAQLAVLARYFKRAHFLLLGDANQAITEHSSDFTQIEQVFSTYHGEVATCRLMTSYRSTPEITALFTHLLAPNEQMQVSSIQPEQQAPEIIVTATQDEHNNALDACVRKLCGEEGLHAVIFPHSYQAQQAYERIIAAEWAPAASNPLMLMDDTKSLPERGVVFISLRLAKGLEFDHVILADASPSAFGTTDLDRRRLYTALSRATHRITLLATSALTPLLDGVANFKR